MGFIIYQAKTESDYGRSFSTSAIIAIDSPPPHQDISIVYVISNNMSINAQSKPKEFTFDIPFNTMMTLINHINARHETIDLSSPEKVQEAREKFSDEIPHKNKVHLPGLGSSFNNKP